MAASEYCSEKVAREYDDALYSLSPLESILQVGQTSQKFDVYSVIKHTGQGSVFQGHNTKLLPLRNCWCSWSSKQYLKDPQDGSEEKDSPEIRFSLKEEIYLQVQSPYYTSVIITIKKKQT